MNTLAQNIDRDERLHVVLEFYDGSIIANAFQC